MTTATPLERTDVIVVGAGIVGLAHAVEAVRRGLSVLVVERDERAVGASVRNFGHGCATAQSGEALRYAMAARTAWIELARRAGFWLREAGTLVVARAEDELAVLAEFAELRGDQVELLDRAGVAARMPVGGDGGGVVGGALLPMDVRVDPRHAVVAIAAWLRGQGVRFLWGTSVWAVEPGLVRTSRGVLRAGGVVVAVGHDVDRHFPELAAEAGLVRCGLQMLRVSVSGEPVIEPAVLTGFSLLRYSGFGACPSLGAVRRRLTERHPDLMAAGVNLMFTQCPDGDLLVGDTHAYARTLDPFTDAALDEAIAGQIGGLLGRPVAVRERWRGVYASAPGREFLVAAPSAGVRVVSVTSGIGMTTALGLAPHVLDDLLAG